MPGRGPMQKWLSSVPILLLSAVVAIVSFQAGCGDGEDDSDHCFRGCSHDDKDKETFLEKLNPFD